MKTIKKPRFSVVIPAYNEATRIGACLEALKLQTIQDFEVLVVDNASTDATAEIAKRHGKNLHLKILQQPIRGRGGARMMGFANATSNIIFSTDADTCVDPCWIETLSSKLEQPNTVAVTGTCRIEDCKPLTNWLFNHLQPLFMFAYRLVFGHFWLTGSNFAINTEVYHKAGGFDPAVLDNEDIDLSFRVSKIGKIRWIRNVPSTTSGERFKKGLFKGLSAYMKVFIKIFLFKDRSATR